MPRRTVLLIAVMALALLATVAAPWTLSGGGLTAGIAKQLRDRYGLDLQVRGRITLAVLPVPRMKLENVTMSAADGAVAAEGGTVRGELRLLPLLLGRVELSDLALSGSRVRLSGDWLQWFQGLASPRPGTALRRVVIAGSSVRWPETGEVEEVNLVVNWAGGDARLDLAGSLSWRGERIDVTQASITPSSLMAGRATPFVLTLAAPAVHLAMSGEVQPGPDPRVSGASRIEIRSARDFARWSGIELPLATVVPAIAVQGEFSADRRRVSWPSVLMTLGPDRLDGTLALRFDAGRPVLTGTLAADRLHLSEVVAPFLQARTATGWSLESLSLAGATGGDLDLRLSAAEASVGRLKLGDMAVSVLVRPGRIETSLSRAALNKGTLKGRLTLEHAGAGAELRAQGAFERIDLGPFLADVGRSRWITGQASGHFALQGGGATAAEVARTASGRMSVAVRQGELLGIGLNEVLKRVEKRPLAASMEWRGGRTPFDLAQLNLTVGGGIAEVAEGSLTAPSLRTSLHGQISLVDRAVDLRALVDPAPSLSPTPLIVFDLTGAWDDIAIVPEAKALIERSGAAKPLFGERLPEGTRVPSAPMATAQ